MLTVNRLKLPAKLRRSLACTNSIENMIGTVRRVCRNVKRWRNAAMALRWTAAGMMEAAKGFRHLKAYRLLSILRAALSLTRPNTSPPKRLNRQPMPHSISHSDACLRLFNKKWGIPLFHRHRLSEVAWLIDICAHDDGTVIGGELHRNGIGERSYRCRHGQQR